MVALRRALRRNPILPCVGGRLPRVGFLSRLDVVMLSTQRLPIGDVPEQLPIAAMRDDMVGDDGLRGSTLALTQDAKRIATKLIERCAIPLRAVASLPSRAAAQVAVTFTQCLI